ncbi:trypsin-like serine protease [Uliginosibacterium sp. H3]|uniref:Trypsin-like serine protease n=1 Tax=Uliginosibacterium silvisoli TaxID=3114758 RepID=A0ABU6JXC5_9RHOO|nr:trypsin-like serine protease [Uliginosibacterium sp. H3]
MLTTLTRKFFLTASILSMLLPGSLSAMMAGTAPDSPASRVDAIVANSDWSGAVAIRTGGNVYSGVLLGDHHVLTAAHIASGAVAKPEELKVIINVPGEASVIAASRIDVFPGYDFPYNDLALIHLAKSAPAEALRYRVQDAPIKPGASIITLVGYGGSGQGDTGVSTGSNESIRRIGENVVDALPDRIDASGRSSAFYLYDFDGPTGTGPLGGITLGNARETMVAGGDSGSPAFVTSAGRIVVMGINTFATPLGTGSAITYTFGQGGGGMRLSDPKFISWLRTASGNEVRLASEPVGQLEGMLVPALAGAGAAGSALLALMLKRRNRKSSKTQ